MLSLAETRMQEVSSFLKKLIKPSTDAALVDRVLTPNPPELDPNMRQELSTVIGRPVASDDAVKSKIEE
jgi:hypothetical protein